MGRTVFGEMSSWTASTWHIGMKTAIKTKNMESKPFGIFIMKYKSERGKCIYKEIEHITTRNLLNWLPVLLLC